MEIYIKNQLGKSEPYSDYLMTELDELSMRVEKLYNLGNKGVHESWARGVFSLLTLRLVLLAYELLYPLKVIKPTVLYEPGIFDKKSTRATDEQ